MSVFPTKFLRISTEHVISPLVSYFEKKKQEENWKDQRKIWRSHPHLLVWKMKFTVRIARKTVWMCLKNAPSCQEYRNSMGELYDSIQIRAAVSPSAVMEKEETRPTCTGETLNYLVPALFDSVILLLQLLYELTRYFAYQYHLCCNVARHGRLSSLRYECNP